MKENISFLIWTWGLALIFAVLSFRGCQIERDHEYRIAILKAAKACVAEEGK